MVGSVVLAGTKERQQGIAPAQLGIAVLSRLLVVLIRLLIRSG